MTNRLARFRAKTESIKLKNDDEPIDIQGLTFPELAEFGELIENKKTKEALNYLLYSTLRKSVPTKKVNPEDGMDDEEVREEIKKMDSGKAMEIINAVKKVSNLPGKEDETKKKH